MSTEKVTSSSGCVFCDLELEPEIHEGKPVHMKPKIPGEMTYDWVAPCTSEAREELIRSVAGLLRGRTTFGGHATELAEDAVALIETTHMVLPRPIPKWAKKKPKGAQS